MASLVNSFAIPAFVRDGGGGGGAVAIDVFHVAECLAVFAVPPSVRVHLVELVETAGV